MNRAVRLCRLVKVREEEAGGYTMLTASVS